MTRRKVVVVGLGPGGHDQVTGETLARIDACPIRYLRTSHHPTAHLLRDATSFDDVYERADSFDEVYATIAERLVAAAAEHGEVLYAVPGSPLVLERTVELLRETADAADVEIELVPAMSFLDVAWARLGIDPIDAGVRLVDGHRFALHAAGESGPLIVAHAHAGWVLSEIKLAVDTPDDHDDTVTVLQRLGTPDEQVFTVPWEELDRSVDPDHLTTLWIPRLSAPVGREYVRFHQLTRTLREQCPWDVEQTHESLVPYLIEETYELVDALRALDPDDPGTDEHLVEELGDVLYQIEFHATIAEQEGRFTIADVARGVHDKLVRRHPHVFGDVSVEGTDEVLSNWDEIKRAEKGRTSAFDGIPTALPSLAYAAKVGARAAKSGFDWPDVGGAFAKIDEEAGELAATLGPGSDGDRRRAELGDLLFAVVNVARHLGIDAEVALREATDTFRARFTVVERLAEQRGIDLREADLAALDTLWVEAKATIS